MGNDKNSVLQGVGEGESPIRSVTDTAFMVAAYRAIESGRVDALFRDPLAAKLAGEYGMNILRTLPVSAFLGGWTVVIRTCIIDGLIRDGLAAGVDTVLNLGAGLDTRPYRMDLPKSLRWIEVDHSALLEHKEACLVGDHPRCQLERIRLDLGDAFARRALLARVGRSSKKMMVLTEGVLPYLDPGSVASLGTDLRSEDSVRYWIVDYFSPASYRYRRRSGMERIMKGAPFLFEPEDFFGFFSEIGWLPGRIRYLAEEGRSLRRPAPFPVLTRVLMAFFRILATRRRRQEASQYAGYVLLEPKPG